MSCLFCSEQFVCMHCILSGRKFVSSPSTRGFLLASSYSLGYIDGGEISQQDVSACIDPAIADRYIQGVRAGHDAVILTYIKERNPHGKRDSYNLPPKLVHRSVMPPYYHTK